MINWPWSKNKKKEIFEDSVQPNDEILFKLAVGDLDLFKEYIYYQHVNWAYEYLGSNSKVWPNTPVLNKHIIILTGAAVKYFDDLGIPYE